VLAPNVALNITVYSYDGKLCFGLVGGKRQIPDLPDLTSYIEASLQVLKDCASKQASHPKAPQEIKKARVRKAPARKAAATRKPAAKPKPKTKATKPEE
jgi:hypothetical protein